MATKKTNGAGKKGNGILIDDIGFGASSAFGRGRVERTQPMGFSADEACDVGGDTGSPASPDYGATGNRFSGDIHWVQIALGEDDHSRLITPEHRFNLAMARE